MGFLYPCQLQEILPGDSVRGTSSALIRVNPLLAPVMHPVTVRIHHWFVPHRLTWETDRVNKEGFEYFITGGPDGDDAQTPPKVNTVAYTPGDNSLFDYFGIDPVDGLAVNAMPFLAYNRIFNEFYRDQDLVDEIAEATNTAVMQCAWERDYLTTSRPNPQKGPDITIPLGDTAKVYGSSRGVTESNAVHTKADGQAALGVTGNDNYLLEVDLSEATATNVNDWRRAFALQRYQEARSRYGSRYSEYLDYLGLKSPDSRLQRPEYLGGGKTTLNFSEVLQTAADDIGAEQTPVGTLRGHGIAAVRTRPFTRHFNEHGYFMSLISIRPKTIYQNGIPRHFLRNTKEDFWQRELQQIGQEPIYNAEVFANHSEPLGTFGWQDRYASYKRTLSNVSGEFRTILDYWHMARKFEAEPALNSQFIQCDATKRIHATQNEHALWMMVQNQTRARRLVRKAANNRIL